MILNFLSEHLTPSRKRKLRKIVSPIRRIGLKNKDFTIISNNCWGGMVYDKFGLQYKTPTIGLIIPSEDYLRFCQNLGHYLSVDASLMTKKEILAKDDFIKKASQTYSIGKVDDVTIIFVHYQNGPIAIEKWNKRRKRVNLEKVILKFNDEVTFNKKQIKIFSSLPYKKIFFCKEKELRNSYPSFSYFIPGGEGGKITDSFKILKLGKIKKIINNL